MELEQNISGQASRQGFEAGLKGLKAMKLEQNNMTKKGTFFWSSKCNKKQARKTDLPVQDSSRSCCSWNQLQLEINVSTDYFSRPTPCSSRQVVNQVGKLMQIGKFKWINTKATFSYENLHQKQNWTRIDNPLNCHRARPHTNTNNQTRSKNTNTNKTNTTQKKTHGINVSTDLLTLIMTIFPLLFCWWKSCRVSKACDRGASRLGEAWPRPRLGRKTDWHKDKARLTGTRCWSPSKAPESWNSSVARPWN